MVKGMKKAAKKEKEIEYVLDTGMEKMPLTDVIETEKEFQKKNGEDIVISGYVRVQARVTRENFEFIKLEALRTGTNVSAIVSIYIADMVEKAKKERGFTGAIV